jgi:hypothetical protein
MLCKRVKSGNQFIEALKANHSDFEPIFVRIFTMESIPILLVSDRTALETSQQWILYGSFVRQWIEIISRACEWIEIESIAEILCGSLSPHESTDLFLRAAKFVNQIESNAVSIDTSQQLGKPVKLNKLRINT